MGASEDSGFWDLVYLLYPEAAEAVGVRLLRELVPNWAATERELAVRFLLSSTLGSTFGASRDTCGRSQHAT